MLLLSLALFLLVLTLPAVPSMRELIRPRDDGMLVIPNRYVRDARWFGNAFRSKLKPFVLATRAKGPSRGVMHMQTDEEVQWAPDLRIPPDERLRGIGVGERVVVGHGAGIRDAYALEDLRVERDVVARTLTSNATMHLGENVRILRWIDADGAIEVGAKTDLGLSASSGGRVVLEKGVRFLRVWGAPVSEHTTWTEPASMWLWLRGRPTLVDERMAAEGKSVVVYGPTRVAPGVQLAQHLKVHGALVIEAGAAVAGNVIVRGNVTLAADVRVGGHIFAEGKVLLGPGCRVGRAGAAKTVYATGEVVLTNGVEVFGWVVSENGGRTA